MATKKPDPHLLPGHVNHVRTESDYMATLLDAVSHAQLATERAVKTQQDKATE